MPPILAATIATLPDKPPFTAEAREAFRRMLDCAIDVAYGPALPVAESPPLVSDERPYRFWKAGDAKWKAAPECVYAIDPDGFAMCDGKAVRFTDVPIGVVFIDQRVAEAGRADLILWDDCGTRTDGAMPAGATLRAP